MQSKLAKAYGPSAETHYDKMLQTMISGAACKYGLTACERDALAEFDRWKQDATYRVDPNTKQSVYCTGLKLGDNADWSLVFQRFVTSTSASEKTFLLEALVCTREPWVISRLLQLTLDQDQFSNLEAVDAIRSLGAKVLGRLMLWDFLVENWDFFFAAYGSGLNLFSKLIEGVTMSFNTRAELKQLKEFVNSREDLGTAKRTFENAISNTALKVDWMETNYDTVALWLSAAIDQQ